VVDSDEVMVVEGGVLEGSMERREGAVESNVAVPAAAVGIRVSSPKTVLRSAGRGKGGSKLMVDGREGGEGEPNED